MKLTRTQQFLAVMLSFTVLGAAFKVMVLVEGLTEVRPANAIPIVAGLAFGPVGALGCAVGNLTADLFGTLSTASALGFAGNFLAAFLPYRLWWLFRHESPNVHTWRNLGLYVCLSLLSALTVAWVLGFGLEYYFGGWVNNVYRYVLLNNFGFSLALGLPLFIVFTSDGVALELRAPRRSGPRRLFTAGRLRGLTWVYGAGQAVILLGVWQGAPEAPVLAAVSTLCLLLLIPLCLLPLPPFQQGISS